MLHPIAPEARAAVRRAMEEELAASDAPPRLNGEAVQLLFGTQTIELEGGQQYDVPPVPFRIGMQLNEMLQRLIGMKARAAELSEDRQREEIAALCREAIPLFRRCVRPRSHWRRLLWPILPNPFADASEGEIGKLLAFLSACRMTSRVRLPSGRGSDRPRST